MPSRALSSRTLHAGFHHPEAASILHRFLDRLQRVRVLDPACGSGNFLYLTLLRLKDLERNEAPEITYASGVRPPVADEIPPERGEDGEDAQSGSAQRKSAGVLRAFGGCGGS